MDRIIISLKKFILLKLKVFFAYFKNINHNPYAIWAILNPPTNVSDFFVIDSDCNKVEFIAENIRAMILGRKVNVTHNFKFFSEGGTPIGEQTFKSKDFYNKITLNKFKTREKYISFIHYVESEVTYKDIFFEKDININYKLSEQNRGYSIFYPLALSSGNVVHGNFGGITKDLKKTAKTSILKHLYTPIYKFENKSKYDIVFNNPTNSILSINVIFNNSSEKTKLVIPSLGTKFLRIKNYYGSLSFESRLPICRALIFKNPTPNDHGTFDVFHS